MVVEWMKPEEKAELDATLRGPHGATQSVQEAARGGQDLMRVMGQFSKPKRKKPAAAKG